MKLFESNRIEKLAALLLLVASVLLAFQAIEAIRNLFQPEPITGTVITVQGMGKVTAIPDVAKVNFSVSEEATTAADAQDAAAKKVNVALALLKDLGVEDKDVKTTSYNVSPKYSYQGPCYGAYCPPVDQRIVGYTASQSVEVTVRDIKKAGDVLSQLGGAGVSNLYGPSFTIDDPDALQAEARAKAIADARTKAKALAKDLGVHLVRVTGFYENTGGYPVYYGKAEALGVGGDVAAPNASVPSLPTGENEVSTTVSVSYEIR